MKPHIFERRMRAIADMPDENRKTIAKILLLIERPAKQRTPVLSGTLRRSQTGKVESSNRGRYGTNLRYAPFVHEGTRYMAARPFMTQGLQDAKGDIDTELEAYGNRRLGGVS